MIRNDVPEQESVKIEVDSYTARMLKLWYDSVKKPLGFDSLGEFLLSAGRSYIFPVSHLISMDKIQETESTPQKETYTVQIEFPEHILHALDLAAQHHNQSVPECALTLIATRLDRLSQKGHLGEHSESIKKLLKGG